VDTKNVGWNLPFLAKVREITNKPVTTIINTQHTHVSGNADFGPDVDIVTHVNTAANMKKIMAVTNNPSPQAQLFQQSGGRGLPKRTFTDTLTLGSGNERVDLYYFGRGHSDGDAWVLFPALRVLHSGDIFSGKSIPNLDYGNGGSGVELPDTLMKAYTATAKNVDWIITGHSTVMTPADLREYVDFNRDFLNVVREGKKAGKSVDEIVKSWTMPAKYKGYAAPQPERLRANIENIYKETR
jgi:glyoxylase-like metal-dependent hydrolase (beta-lactamase superfamily II)